MEQQTNDRLIPLTQVISATSLSRTEIYRRIQSGDFPAQVRITARRVAWSANAVQAWVNDRLNGIPA